MKKILILILFFSGTLLFAQDYEYICSPGITLYRGSSGNVKAFRRDSVYPQGNQDSIFISYRTLRPFLINGCYDTTNGSILGRRIYKTNNGIFYFFNWNRDTLTVLSQAVLNQSWKFCKLPNLAKIEATVESVLFDSILGQPDSVKIITFQAKDVNGNNITHFLNQKTMRLSRHFGISMTYDLYYMPDVQEYDASVYYLDGKTSPVVGLQNLTWRDVYNFDVGDEFQWYGSWQGAQGPITRTLKRVLAKEVLGNLDSVNYTMEYCKTLWLPDPPYIETIYDTILESYNFLTMGNNATIENLPQFFQGSGNHHAPYYERWFGYSDHQTQEYNTWVYTRTSGFCWNDPFEPSYSKYQYSEGLGRTLYFHQEYQNWPVINSEEMVYYKKGDVEWGTPMAQDCNQLVPVQEKSKPMHPEVLIIPNPVESQAEISFVGIVNIGLHYLLINELGENVRIREIDSNPFIFDRAALPGGFYIISILDPENNILVQGKMLIR